MSGPIEKIEAKLDVSKAKTITVYMREKLLKAIEGAQQWGGCQYRVWEDGVEAPQPCCVIGQLAFLEGIDLNTLHGAINQHTAKDSRWEPFWIRGYPVELLTVLQRTWDCCEVSPTAEDAKRTMRAIVTAWPCAT